MISLENSRRLLKLVGEEFVKYYTEEIFKFQKNIKLLIDDNTFYIKCTQALNKMNTIYNTDYVYEDCLEAYNAVGSDFDIYGNSSLSKNNYLIAISIAVFQVLLAYKELPAKYDDNPENGYYEQLKTYYPSFRKTNSIPKYFSKQEELWLHVKEYFESEPYCKSFELPTSGHKNVKYPHSQRILNPKDFRYLCSKFKSLDASKDYTLDEFRKFYSTYDDFIITLIHNAYKSWKQLELKPKFYSDNDTELGTLFFDESGNLTDDYSILNMEDFVHQPIYFYQIDNSLFCTEPPEDETNVGVLIRTENHSKYDNIPHSLLSTANTLFSFLFIKLTDLRNTGLYKKYYSTVKIHEDKKYKFINGLLLDGRNNSFDKAFLPDIVFDFDCNEVLITDTFGTDTFPIRNNTLRLSLKELKSKYKNHITVTVPNQNIKPIEINIVKTEIDNIAFKEDTSLGWNLKDLSPAKENSINCLTGLNFSERIEREKDEKNKYDPNFTRIEITTPYVNCNYGGNIYITNVDEIKNIIRTILFNTCKFGKTLPVGMILETIKNEKKDYSTELHTYLSYYRLIKQCILDFYKNEHTLFIIFYGKNKDSEELKPYIKRISYRPGVYLDDTNYNFFEEIKVFGRRYNPRFDTTSLLISCDKIASSLKHLTSDINYQVSINKDILNNKDYAIDYLEYYEIILHLQKVEISNFSKGTYKINLSNVEIPYNSSPSERIDFTSYQEIDFNDEKILQKNNPIRYLQQMLYKYIQINGKVSWKQITSFMKFTNGEYTVYDVFYPLYILGFIDVCYSNYEAYYFITRIKLLTSNPFIGLIKSKVKFPDFEIYTADVSKIPNVEQELALTILKNISPLEDIIRSWTKVAIDTDNLNYGYNFGSIDGIDKPRYKRILNDNSFVGLCRDTNDKRLMVMHPAYFKFSRGEVYQVPKRTMNPNAERIAKLAMRGIQNTNEKRIIYNPEKKEITCYQSDIPIPILRALYIANPMKLGNPEIFLNKIEDNKIIFEINDSIFNELKRIFTLKIIEVTEDA